ncbi:MAG: V-type ATPase 116kDa subunit family protein [Candidatus Heimdallarchaeaceae archaeon]
MAKVVLSKIQVPKDNTLNLISKIVTLDNYDQIIVDPQSPKEQARIQEIKDNLENSFSRLVKIGNLIKIPFKEIETKEKLPFEKTFDLSALQVELETFFNKYEEKIFSQISKLEQLKKEARILGGLNLFKRQIEDDKFTIDLLSSNSRTFTLYGEIPSSYEELLRFYLNEITEGKIFFWSVSPEGKKTKTVICISLLNYQSQVEALLEQNYFEATSFDLSSLKTVEDYTSSTAVSELYSKVSSDLDKIEKEIEEHLVNLTEQIIFYINSIRAEDSLLLIEEKGRTDETMFTLWGWVDAKKYDEFEKEINSIGVKPKFSILDDVPLKPQKTVQGKEELRIEKPPEDKKEKEKDVPHLSHRGVNPEGGLFFAKKASFVKMVVKNKNRRQFISFIRSLNVVHPVKIGSLDIITVESLNAKRIEFTQYQARIKKITEMLNIQKSDDKISAPYQIVNDLSHSKAFIENFLNDYEKEVTSIFNDYNQFKKERDQLDLYLPTFEEMKGEGMELMLSEGGSQTITFLGSIPKNHLKEVRFFLNEVTDSNIMFLATDPSGSRSDEKNLFVLALKEYEVAISRVLNEYSFKTIEYDLDLLHKEDSLEDKKNDLLLKIEELESRLDGFAEKISDKLSAVEELINVELDRITTEEICQVSENKTILWGWVPGSAMENLFEKKEELKFKIDITVTDKVPLTNPSITKRGKAFGAIGGIIGGIGQPNPHEVDPYAIMRFTFPIIFGIMFADLGHGIMLALIGAFLAIRKRRKKIKPSESISGYLYSGSELLIFCGLAASIFGILFGTLLGDEVFLHEIYHNAGIEWLPLITPLEETKLLLVVALLFGFLLIQIGILLKVYQNIKYGHGFASWGAPLTLSIVYVGIFAMLYNIIADGVSSLLVARLLHVTDWYLPLFPSWVVYLVGLVPVLFILEYMHAKSDGIMDAIDHIIALISNTLSFSRIMALLLVHGILSSLPFGLTGIDPHTSALATAWWYWIVGIAMGLFIIVPIEGLLSFLNTLRLHWVEFFSKFYVGDGKEYNPLKENLDFIELVPEQGG